MIAGLNADLPSIWWTEPVTPASRLGPPEAVVGRRLPWAEPRKNESPAMRRRPRSP